MAPWTNRQEANLLRLYASSTREEIIAVIPHSWLAIVGRARRFGLHRGPRQRGELNPIVDALLKKRVSARLSQGGVARTIGINRASLSRFENGKALPRLTDLEPWCAAVGLQITLTEKSDSIA